VTPGEVTSGSGLALIGYVVAAVCVLVVMVVLCLLIVFFVRRRRQKVGKRLVQTHLHGTCTNSMQSSTNAREHAESHTGSVYISHVHPRNPDILVFVPRKTVKAGYVHGELGICDARGRCNRSVRFNYRGALHSYDPTDTLTNSNRKRKNKLKEVLVV
jgi:hypothetical protein